MPSNLRIKSITIVDSSNIIANFTETLSEDISVSNITIISQTPGVSDISPLIVSVVENALKIQTQPLVPLASYLITFQSTPEILFQSINGDAILLNNSIANQQIIIGPIAANNPILTYLTNFLSQNVYNTESGSIISTYIQALSQVMSKALYDVKQSGNENYLSFTVVDEFKTRGPGPFDRLDEECAYEVLRVGLTPTGTNLTSTTSIASFPPYVVSLLAAQNSEILTTSSDSNSGTFNVDTLTLNLSASPVIILTSIIFTYNSLATYTYDIQIYGYQILDSQYDPNFASTYYTLNNNQIVLNSKILNDPNFSTENIFSINVSYQFKDLGKIIDPTTLVIDTDLPSGYETVPPIENVFTLQHAPIVGNNDENGVVGDVIFIDPNAPQGSGNPHPAFIYEVPFTLTYIPAVPGQYSVDYATGNVYVYGTSNTRDGTGPFPPLATYIYRYVFKEQVDYVYDTDTSDLVALQNGSLINSPANMTFNYEEVLVQNVDYIADTHIEVLSENVQNNLIALNAIRPQNFPITDVFRIFNQTTGEIYGILRWTNNIIYFNYVNAPNIVDVVQERATFQEILNELLFVNTTTNISSSINLFKFLLQNNNLIAATEDCIGSSINTSVSFSEPTIFIQERYYDDTLSISENNGRLVNIGDYQIDYINGIVYAYVSITQSISVGTISYRRGYIQPNNLSIITVDDIYYQINLLTQKNKQFQYTNFSYGEILPSSFDVANEGFLNNNSIYPYVIDGGQIGTFEALATFVPGVSNPIKFVRGVFEQNDLLFNINPINFAPAATFNNTIITVSSLSYTEYHNVQFDGTNYYILANTNLVYQSPNITLTASVIRLVDNKQLWSGSGIVLGSPLRLNLSSNSPNAGDAIILTYFYTITNLARTIVDYNRGDYYIDYSYLADEIIISYEYGDNDLDFGQSLVLNEGDNYYVSYKVGALRDGLIKNFGTLINIPILNTFDVSFERERYRDALMAALQSFTAGPTKVSMENLVSIIAHAPPEVIESAFQNWTLGVSLLNPEPIATTGTLQLAPCKYDNGVVMNEVGQTIKFPVNSNLRLEQGSFECWISPNWNGIDNQSNLTIQITKNGQPLPIELIFIGPTAYHPSYPLMGTPSITLNTLVNNVSGKPNESKDGVFIYYAPDISGTFDRWYIDVFDGYSDGYEIKNYVFALTTDGQFYNVLSTQNPQPSSDQIFSGTNTVSYTISGSSNISTGITFVADYNHYIFDFGKEINNNRFSIFKDESGYINFRIFDENSNRYIVSSNVSTWQAGQLHYISTSWALNTLNGQDEIHLFIDGFEVPNILRFRDKISPYTGENFRTIDPEEIIGLIPKNVVASVDLTTTAGLNIVSSSLDFNAYGITVPSTIYIEEPGFSSVGYSITLVNGQQLTLSATMPFSTTNSAFTINKTTLPVEIEIDLYPNIAVSLLHLFSNGSGTDLTTIATMPTVSSVGTNFTTIGVQSGDFLVINQTPTTDINSQAQTIYTIVAVNNNNLTLNSDVPSSGTNQTFTIYSGTSQEIPGIRALRPSYEFSRDNYGNVSLIILNSALAGDIVLIETLGVNNRRIIQKYYVWGNTSNLIMTKLPPPIVLNDVQITHILLDRFLIQPSNSVIVGNSFTSNQIPTDQPSLSDNGRFLSVYISGDNVNYATPLTVVINGTVGGTPNTTETLSYPQNETQITTDQFETVNYIQVSGNANDPTQSFVVVRVQESVPITITENSNTVPVIRFSYQMLLGTTLSSSGGSVVSDANIFFSANTIGNYLVISQPAPAAGQYQIMDVSEDHHSITINGIVPAFTGGSYQVLNTTTYRSGLQNGFFTFEDGYVSGDGYGVPYPLVQGLYEFDYYTYISIPIDTTALYGCVGTDFMGNNPLNGTIDELQIISEMLTDTRVGETSLINQETITKNFYSLKELEPNVNTLMLLHFDNQPFENAASVYTTATQQFIQSSIAVNDNFNKSIVLTNQPYIVNNTGILATKTQGSIEFWVNPLFDTSNDPNYRYYFDASSIVRQETVSINNATVKVSGTISQVLSVKLQVGNQSTDYFAGGSIDPNMQTIYLNTVLPSQETPVIITYIPNGTDGDRMSIYKDPVGFINFYVKASGEDFVLRGPIYWNRGTWHRVRATFIFNQGLGIDEMRFFVDGYEEANALVGSGSLFGQGQVFGATFGGVNNISAAISFQDTINNLFIGSDYTGSNGAYALIDNFRISNISRPLFSPFGEPIDVNYSPNLDIVLPVQSDLYTTLLLDFNSLVELNTNFAMLKNRFTGNFDITLNINDPFGFISGSDAVKQTLETLIDTLKPACSFIFINYIESP